MNKKMCPSSNDYSQESLAKSFEYCRNLAKNSNFYLPIRLAAAGKREAIFSIYAWLRVLDDIADEKNKRNDLKLRKLNHFYHQTISVIENTHPDYPSDKYWLAFKDTVLKYNIPNSLLEKMVKGQSQDLEKTNYPTFNELYNYCYLVASVVCFMLIKIYGHENNRKVNTLAEQCGIAFQLTNILRDVNEDLSLKRVYLPAEFFGRNILTAEQFPELSQEQLMLGIQKVIDYTKEYYKNSANLYHFIHLDGKLSYLAMHKYYRSIFNKIEANPKLIFLPQKVRLTKFEKLKVLVSSIYQHTVLGNIK